ncbi:MAG: hypothetical protein IJK63_07830 [Oscillospiraceae bacterium]|nr:hypothetical protein [Oscillospiraceae bacterium]
MESILVIAFAVGIVLLAALLRYVLYRLADKAEDAVRNARIRSRSKSAPPQPVRLADRCGRRQSGGVPRG